MAIAIPTPREQKGPSSAEPDAAPDPRHAADRQTRRAQEWRRLVSVERSA
jgi:hypothetical protein